MSDTAALGAASIAVKANICLFSPTIMNELQHDRLQALKLLLDQYELPIRTEDLHGAFEAFIEAAAIRRRREQESAAPANK